MPSRQPRPQARRISKTPATVETSVLRKRSEEAARDHARPAARQSATRRPSAGAPSPQGAKRTRTDGSRGASHAPARKTPVSRTAPRSQASARARSSRARTPEASRLVSRLLRSKAFAGIAAIGVAVAVICGIDVALNAGKIYPGVSIAGIDVSGMTPEEAATAISEKHSAAFEGNSVVIYADQQTADRAAAGEDVFSEVQVDEESVGSQHAWRVDAESLQASFNPADAAAKAFAVGRADGGLPARISALASGRDIGLSVTFNDAAIENIAAKIDSVAGDPRVDSDIVIEEGVATAVEGHDGMMVNRDDFKAAINSGLLDPENPETQIIASVEHAPMHIDLASAQATADLVNESIRFGVQFAYGDQTWEASASECGSWVTTEPVFADGVWTLEPGIDSAVARAQLKGQVEAAVGLADCTVAFESSSDGVTVRAQAQGQIPMLQQALDGLPAILFGQAEGRASTPRIEVPAVDVPESMSFEQACELGIVVKISAFTTEYTDDYPTRNHNIHLMADYLDGSVAKAHSDWSMLDTSGEISEAAGYQAASQIVDGELVDDFGGGVCQVATTVFNAVYESGFPVPVRHNHSLYMSSYPDGRDAAIAWSYLDLVWTNDSDSDVLVRTSHTDTTVTVELWGVGPGYSIESQTGEWSKGADYKVKVKYDASLKDDEVKEEKKGKDGSSITVVRKVYAADGTLLREDSFSSTYDPVNRIVSIKGDDESKVMTQDEFKALLEKREEEKKGEQAAKDAAAESKDTAADAA